MATGIIASLDIRPFVTALAPPIRPSSPLNISVIPIWAASFAASSAARLAGSCDNSSAANSPADAFIAADFAASAVAVASGTPATISFAPPNALPIPKLVIPDIRPFFKSPVLAASIAPDATALPSAALEPRAVRPPPMAPINPVDPAKAPPAAVNAAGANWLIKGIKKGRKASGCPVTGLVVNFPPGTNEAMP